MRRRSLHEVPGRATQGHKAWRGVPKRSVGTKHEVRAWMGPTPAKSGGHALEKVIE